MLLWSIKAAIVSFVLILVIHQLIIFFTNTLTVPKFKDLVDGPNKRHKKMLDAIETNDNVGMKKELKDYLKKQLSENQSS